ncbi:hypothetical protein H8356DRAFT_1741157 [Neocallimastix lanati (nom. inval.)]|jgi:hypothetical protein|uniref:Dynactin subunit 4 n=1 Tax=Neocallimastix californiae TaxID=1754190 RepID=A0A1Y2BS54_9FUNG|nr:hypothetical protein H8356DRAFT_1741157 [Neocallimastix sp. JGI-2020a]ORY37553.1 hypothetical protein LY90DRAFT_672823 [Neocallimastix californiae]|eukprot:ORY37553.1 hypothetical protein LY90DRAFT_672823 [Neocallimastix californiae]
MENKRSSERNDIPFPYVHYQCTCQVVSKIRRDVYLSTFEFPLKDPIESEINSTTISHFPPNSFNHYRLKSIYDLYFCPSCCELHCPDCVKNDFLCFYCPNCLFDVPQASVVSEQNRCIRNCFQCPVCFNVLTVVSQKENLISPISPATPSDEQNLYYLMCNVCQWKSLEINLSFDKSTGLYLQLQKKESMLPHENEFQNLKNYYDKILRSNNNMNNINTKRLSALFGNSSSLLLSPSVISHIPDLKSKLMLTKKENNRDGYEYKKDNQDSTLLMEDEMEMIKLKNLDTMDELTTLEQKLNQPEDQPRFTKHLRIHRIPLRVKLQTKCTKCEKILIKQEVQKMKKPSNVRFSIKYFARDYIPNIFIQQLIPNKPLHKDIPVQVLLKFVNPLPQDITVSLSTLSNKQSENQMEKNTEVDKNNSSPTTPKYNRRTSSLINLSPILSQKKKKPSLKISTAPIIPLNPVKTSKITDPYSKSERYSSCNVTVLAKNFIIPAYDPLNEFESEPESPEQKIGIFEKKKNSVSIIVEVRPTGNINDRVEFPILVTYSFVNDEKEVNNETPISPNYAELSHGVQKFVSFWTVIGIGKITPDPV